MGESIVERREINSNVLKKEMPLTVYLPKKYNECKALPVLYFLHGRSGDENIMAHLDLQSICDRLIEEEVIKPVIIVCPSIDNSRGINSSLKYKEVKDPHGRIINLGMYEDYFIKEVIPYIDNTYNTIKNRSGRFIGGASAGGYAALHNALRNKDLFSKVGGHMPALELRLEEEDQLYFKDFDNWEAYSPLSIVKKGNLPKDLEVYLDAGDNDEGEFYKGCLILHEMLEKIGIDSQNHVFSGHHNVEYIKSNIEKYMKFYIGNVDET